jgi:hypothetical protein
MLKNARKFIVDAAELLQVNKIQPVKLAITASEDAEGFLVIEHMRASTAGTIEDLNPLEAKEVQGAFNSPSTVTK